jgi:hypothetical protein
MKKSSFLTYSLWKEKACEGTCVPVTITSRSGKRLTNLFAPAIASSEHRHGDHHGGDAYYGRGRYQSTTPEAAGKWQ